MSNYKLDPSQDLTNVEITTILKLLLNNIPQGVYDNLETEAPSIIQYLVKIE